MALHDHAYFVDLITCTCIAVSRFSVETEKLRPLEISNFLL